MGYNKRYWNEHAKFNEYNKNNLKNLILNKEFNNNNT
jgi:hypothetical protein